jgi:hypothetical protein
MRKFSYINERCLTNQNKIILRKDETYQKFLDIKREINSIKRNINNKFNFENFSQENLQPLEIVSQKNLIIKNLFSISKKLNQYL